MSIGRFTTGRTWVKQMRKGPANLLPIATEVLAAAIIGFGFGLSLTYTDEVSPTVGPNPLVERAQRLPSPKKAKETNSNLPQRAAHANCHLTGASCPVGNSVASKGAAKTNQPHQSDPRVKVTDPPPRPATIDGKPAPDREIGAKALGPRFETIAKP